MAHTAGIEIILTWAKRWRNQHQMEAFTTFVRRLSRDSVVPRGANIALRASPAEGNSRPQE